MAQDIKKINGVYMGSQEIASTRFAGDAVAYYRGEGNANDSTANAYNGTATDITYGTAYGKFGQGMLFNGTSSKIALPDMNASLSTAVSFSFWAKITDTQSTGYVWVWQAGDSPELKIVMDRGASLTGFNFLVYDASAYQANLYAQIPNSSEWHHYVAVATTNDLRIYIDGQLKSSDASGSFNIDAYSEHNIGYYSGIGAGSYFKGQLDDVCIRGSALTSDEIYSLYKTGVKKLNGQVNLNPELESTSLRGDANLQMYQRFEGNSTDETANNNDGTDTGITYGTAYGKMGQGASFTNDDTAAAASSYIRIANSASLSPGTGNFSISLWYKTSDTRTSNIHGLLMKYNSTNNNNVYFIAEAVTTGYIRAYFRDGDGDAVDLNSTKSYRDGLWHHIVSVRNGTSGHLYIDGNLIASATNVAMSNIDTNTAGSYFWIGTWSANTTPGQRTQSLTGNLDDLAIFNRALSATEISNLYNTNIKKYMGVDNT